MNPTKNIIPIISKAVFRRNANFKSPRSSSAIAGSIYPCLMTLLMGNILFDGLKRTSGS